MSSDSVKETGCVKWFNNKSGYGFISSCDNGGCDVFVHHSSLVVKDEQYRYLVAGEYVCLLYTSPSPRDGLLSRMPSSA